MAREDSRSVDDAAGEKEIYGPIGLSVRGPIIRRHSFEEVVDIWKPRDLGD